MNIKNNNLKLKEFDYMRAIGIFLVVLGHSFPFIDESNNHFFKYLHNLIYSFHMPLFIILSGFFANKITQITSLKKYKNFIYTKFQKLIVPYIFISFLTLPIKLILNSFSERKLEISSAIIDIFLYPWKNPIIFFWFIYVLFILFLISPLIIKLNKYIVLIISLFASIFFITNIDIFGISTLFKYSIFFFIGIYLNPIYIKFRNNILNYKLNMLNIIIIFIIPFCIFLLNIQLSVNNPIINNLFFLFKSFLGIYITFVVCLFILKLKHIKILHNTLTMLCKYSFDIYLLSWFPQIFIRILFYQILEINYTIVVIISLFSGFLPILISKYILRKYKLTKKIFLGLT